MSHSTFLDCLCNFFVVQHHIFTIYFLISRFSLKKLKVHFEVLEDHGGSKSFRERDVDSDSVPRDFG